MITGRAPAALAAKKSVAGNPQHAASTQRRTLIFYIKVAVAPGACCVTFSDRDLLSIVDDIYQASVEPEAWQRVVDGIQALLPAAGVCVQGYYGGDHVIVRQGHDPAVAAKYVQDHAHDNPWTARMPSIPAGVPMIVAE